MLESLSFGRDFNQSLEHVQLDSLQSLCFGQNFNQTLESVCLVKHRFITMGVVCFWIQQVVWFRTSWKTHDIQTLFTFVPSIGLKHSCKQHIFYIIVRRRWLEFQHVDAVLPFRSCSTVSYQKYRTITTLQVLHAHITYLVVTYYAWLLCS